LDSFEANEKDYLHFLGLGKKLEKTWINNGSASKSVNLMVP